MLNSNALRLSEKTVIRVSMLMLLVGLISLAQAANLIPFGSSEYPDALALIAFGSAFLLTDLGQRKAVYKYTQSALMFVAIALVIIY